MDGSRFVVTFQQPISQSLPHIYVSALPFAPMQSPIAMKMCPLFANSLSVVNGRMRNWPAMLLALEGHEGGVNSVAFSADGTRIVSGSFDKTIRVWDAGTGKSVMEPLRGHKGRVNSVAFSADGTRIVSGSDDNTIRVWDAHTGKSATEPLRGHLGGVKSVTFSADGTRIVSGSNDKTIRSDTAIDSYYFAFLDGRGVPTFCPNSKLNRDDGWLYDANGNILFWVPPMNRAGLYYPQTTMVIGVQATQIDLSRFMHGEHWTHQNVEEYQRVAAGSRAIV